jgi:UPF0716 family protein affecting phage T7 exclusion
LSHPVRPDQAVLLFRIANSCASPWIPFLLLVIPLAEIAAFVVIGGQIGVWATLGMVLLTAVIGSISASLAGCRPVQQESMHGNAGQSGFRAASWCMG